MNRRDTVLALAALGAAPLVPFAQAAGKIPRLCFMTFDPGTMRANRYGAFFEALRRLGYEDGKTIAIDYLSANGRAEQYSAMAAECTRLKADVIVVSTTPAAQAAKKATRTIPIVMLALGDPVGSGLIDSLARPGGNVTGMSFMAPELAAKRLEMLKELTPRVSRVLVLTYGADPISAPQVEMMQNAARKLGVSLQIRDIRSVDDIPPAFDAGAKERAEGLLVTGESIFQVNRGKVIELAAKHKLPTVYTSQVFPPDGGLMAYSADIPSLYVGAASYVDKILKGAKPAELPAVQASEFEFVINMKTAKALGIAIPKSFLVRANKLID